MNQFITNIGCYVYVCNGKKSDVIFRRLLQVVELGPDRYRPNSADVARKFNSNSANPPSPDLPPPKRVTSIQTGPPPNRQQQHPRAPRNHEWRPATLEGLGHGRRPVLPVDVLLLPACASPAAAADVDDAFSAKHPTQETLELDGQTAAAAGASADTDATDGRLRPVHAARARALRPEEQDGSVWSFAPGRTSRQGRLMLFV